MSRLPNADSETALSTICSNIAQALISHRKKHDCTCDLRFLRLGRVDAASNDPNAHRCSDTDLQRDQQLPGKTVLDWIQLHNALCFCCCFFSGVNWPTRFSSPVPNHDDYGSSGNLRKAEPNAGTLIRNMFGPTPRLQRVEDHGFV
ncbi:unnamed protein product [Aureobasidium vineae]|uniref:Uncharacterized protein n=1 Tax=Aureobasidium vineae TaxID=2773715 RepID=A0A9N8P7G9_9PEZI|nr:unnamed protein product [Aureobasidium vineae]